jgi:hypothetical protein
MRNLLTAGVFVFLAQGANAQLAQTGPPCEEYAPSSEETAAILSATDLVPKVATADSACVKRTFIQVRPGELKENDERIYTFIWLTGVRFGQLEHWESAWCVDKNAQVLCEPRSKGVRRQGKQRIETGENMTDSELAEVLEFVEGKLGESDIRGLWKVTPPGAVNWSRQAREYGVEVLKDGFWRASYQLTYTCTFSTSCTWQANGPNGSPIP